MLRSILIIILLASSAFASWNQKFVSVVDQKLYDLTSIVAHLRHGQVIIVSETHDFKPDHDNQVTFLTEMGRLGLLSEISVAMEFFDYTKQDAVDSFLAGDLAEADFLKAVEWGPPADQVSFNFYRDQVLFPAGHNGRTYAINLPRKIADKIAKDGLDSLSESERDLLPSNFTLGNPFYRQRFIQAMTQGQGGHSLPAQKIENYFTAQSAWDDTMAWQISKALEQDPSQTIVVIVGNFHAQFGGGLPDRLRARGVTDILNITQYFAPNGKLGDLYKYIQPNHLYGPVSDLVWIQGEPR